MNISNAYSTKLCGMIWKITVSTAATSSGSIIISDGNTNASIPVTTALNTPALVAAQIETYINQGFLSGWSAAYVTSSSYLTLYTSYQERSLTFSPMLTGVGVSITEIASDYREDYQTFASRWNGLEILKIDNFDKRGKAKNISTQSWVNSDKEDVHIPDIVYFEQPDIDITFYINDFYDHSVNVEAVHLSFIDYMTTHKYAIKSLYAGSESDFVCVKDYAPTTERLHRSAGQNVVMGTITVHRIKNNLTVLS
jgi:hypothetical protein